MLVAGGLLVLYVVWGSVYVAIRYVVEDVPALLSIGVRYVVAGLLLAAYVASRHGPGVLRARRRALVGCLLLGVLLGVLTNGTVTWAESVGLQAGPAALLTALAPIAIVLLRLGTGDRPRAVTWLGVVVGFGGSPCSCSEAGRCPASRGGPPSWSSPQPGAGRSGSFLQPRLLLPPDTFVTAAYQLLAGRPGAHGRGSDGR